MKRFLLVAVIGALFGVVLWTTLRPLVVDAQVIPYVPPDRLRFRILADEGIALQDGHTVASNWKVVVLKDMHSGQCHVVFMGPVGMTVMNAAACE